MKALMKSRFQTLLAFVMVFGILQVPGWAQCVMCGTALSSSPESKSLAASFRWGIAILMVMPYVILGSIGYAIYRAFRRRKAARSAEFREPIAETNAGWLSQPVKPVIPRGEFGGQTRN
jgi:branched-subunit amino acid ABC-type transport system permease component